MRATENLSNGVLRFSGNGLDKSSKGNAVYEDTFRYSFAKSKSVFILFNGYLVQLSTERQHPAV